MKIVITGETSTGESAIVREDVPTELVASGFRSSATPRSTRRTVRYRSPTTDLGSERNGSSRRPVGTASSCSASTPRAPRPRPS